MSKENKELFEFGDFRLDVGERRLERLDGNPTGGSLRDKAFEVLVYLVRNSGKLVTKDEVLSVVWPDAIVEEANLNKAIHVIRQFFGEAASEQKYIETVPKHGYRFVAGVKRIESGLNGDMSVAEVIQVAAGSIKKSSANGDSESTNELETIAETYESTKNEQPKAFSAEAFRVAAVVLIGVLGLGGLLVANNWRSFQSQPRDAAPTNAPDNHSKAYDLYVRGKVKAGIENREETEAAIMLLEEAVALNPAFAEAYAQLARVYNTKAFKYAADAERKHFYENAEVAIEKSLALNPDLAEAHFARGLILWNNTKRFPHEQAIRSYKRSLELDPGQDETHQQLSMVYAHIGLMDEAQAMLNKALELNPNNTMARFRVGNYLAWQGKFEEALAVLKTVPSEVSPVLVERIRAEVLIQIGHLGEAESLVDEYLSGNPVDEGGSFTSLKALLLAKAGKHDEAVAMIKRSIEIGKGFGHFHHTEYNIASTFATLNEPEEAVKWLENTAENGFPNYTYISVDPNLDNLRQNARFIELMRKLEQQRSKFSRAV